MSQDFYTVSEVEEATGLDGADIRTLLRLAIVPAYKVGNNWAVDGEGLAQLQAIAYENDTDDDEDEDDEDDDTEDDDEDDE